MTNSDKKYQHRVSTRLTPLTIAMIFALPAVTHSAELSMKNGTIYNANGVPVVDINKPNSNGLSHNVWDKLNVDKKGIIFNNSASAASTVLAGTVQGNSNLSDGAAKAILNEVTSKNPTTINGMMEIAGDKADLIIANPNGITVSSGGSINATKLTLTTGKPDIQDDELRGYSVNGGTITLGKLDSASPTEILSRNVVVNGNVSADEINVVTGNNYVNTAGKVTNTVQATGARNANSIDVAKLGGMYANKINLVSTESGVGVRNQGVIMGGKNGISIDAKGQLLNSNAQIQSDGVVNLKTAGALDNTSGNISSNGTISIDTNKNSITNARGGKLTSVANIYVNSGAINNTNGKVTAGGMLAVDTNKQTLTNAGKGKNVGIEAGVVALNTGTLNNSNGQMRGVYVGLETTSLNNNGGILEASDNITVISNGNVDNNKGLIRSASGRVDITTAGALNNTTTKTADTTSADTLGIAAEKGVKIGASTINNNGGQMASNGDLTLESNGAVDNFSGKILSSNKVDVKAKTYRNDNGGISGKQGVNVTVDGNLTNFIGVVSSEEGTVALSANSVDNHGGFMMGQDISLEAVAGVNNNTAMIVANKKLTVKAGGNIDNRNANTFGNNYGLFFGMPQQTGGMIGKGGIELSAQNIYNTDSRMIAENGSLNLQTKGSFDNTRGLVSSGADAVLKMGDMLYNNYATIHSAGNLNIDTTNLQNYSSGNFLDNNATGVIAADNNLVLNVDNNLNNYGWISGKGDVALNVVKGALYNRNTLSAGKSLTINAQNGIENSKDLAAGSRLTLETQRYVTNAANSNIVANDIVINATNDITNRGSIVSDGDQTLTTEGNVYNYLYLVGQGDISITANSVNNNNAVIDATGGLDITTTGNISNTRGTLRAQTGNMNLTATKGNVDNYYGKLISHGDNTLNGNNLLNDYGQINSNENIALSLTGNLDNNRGSVAAKNGDITLSANTVDNNNGFIAGENVTIDADGGVYNNTALIAADKALVVNAAGNIENRDGNNFGRDHGVRFDLVGSAGGMIGNEGLTLTGQNIYNSNSNLIAEKGPLTLTSRGVFDNTRAAVKSGSDAIVNVAGVFYNNYAITYSVSNLDITTSSLENYSSGTLADNTATGIISADKNLNLNVNNSVNNYGWISGKGDVNVNVTKGVLYNRNAISADKTLTINALDGVENVKDLVAGTTLTIGTQKHVANSSTGNMLGQNIVINAQDNISNYGNIVSNYWLSVHTAGDVYNHLNLLSYGAAKVTADNVVNSGTNAVLGGFYGLDMESKKTDSTGTIVGM